MRDYNYELQKIQREIEHKAKRGLSRMIVQQAMVNNITTIEIETKYKKKVQEWYKDILAKEQEKRKKDIAKLQEAIEKINKPKPKAEKQPKRTKAMPKVDTKPSEEPKPRGRVPKPPFTDDEIEFMKQKYLYEQVGYRAIASMIGKDELKVRKQIAQIVSETVA